MDDHKVCCHRTAIFATKAHTLFPHPKCKARGLGPSVSSTGAGKYLLRNGLRFSKDLNYL